MLIGKPQTDFCWVDFNSSLSIFIVLVLGLFVMSLGNLTYVRESIMIYFIVLFWGHCVLFSHIYIHIYPCIYIYLCIYIFIYVYIYLWSFNKNIRTSMATHVSLRTFSNKKIHSAVVSPTKRRCNVRHPVLPEHWGGVSLDSNILML